MREGKPTHYSVHSPDESLAFSRFKTADDLAANIYADDIEQRNIAQHAMHSIYHICTHYWDWLGSKELLERRKKSIFHIGFQETLSNDFAELICKLGMPHVELSTDRAVAHCMPLHYQTTLSKIATDNLLKWYSGDYDCIEICKRLKAEDSFNELP